MRWDVPRMGYDRCRCLSIRFSIHLIVIGFVYYQLITPYAIALAPNSQINDVEESIRAIEKSRRVVLAMIRQRAANGHSLQKEAVRREDPDLYNIVANLYEGQGGWRGAVKAANIPVAMPAKTPTQDANIAAAEKIQTAQESVRIEPAPSAIGVKETARDKVLSDIREREKQGKSLRSIDVFREDEELIRRARYQFSFRGGWYGGALKSIGKTDEEIALIRASKKATRAKKAETDQPQAAPVAPRTGTVNRQSIEFLIQKNILSRHHAERSVDEATVKTDDPYLHLAATLLYENWDAAKAAAGVVDKPVSISEADRGMIALIKKRIEDGKSLKQEDVKRDNEELVESAMKRHKSWAAVLRLADLSQEDIKRYIATDWPADRVLIEIRARHAQGKALDSVTVFNENRRLYSAGNKRFADKGGWYGAVRAAGFTVEREERKKGSTRHRRKNNLQVLRSRYRDGKSLLAMDMIVENEKLVKAIEHQFRNEGGWYAALAAAGVPDADIVLLQQQELKRRRAVIVAAFTERESAGLSLAPGIVRAEDLTLFRKVYKYFEGDDKWQSALIDMGKNQSEIARIMKPVARAEIAKRNRSRKNLLEELAERYRSGQSIVPKEVKKEDPAFEWAVRWKWPGPGGWERALREAGIPQAAIPMTMSGGLHKAEIRPAGIPQIKIALLNRDVEWPYGQLQEIDLHRQGERLRNMLAKKMSVKGKLSLAKAMEDTELRAAGPLVVLLLAFDLVHRHAPRWEPGKFVVDIPALELPRSLPIVWSAFHNTYGEQPTTHMLSVLYGYERSEETIRMMAERLEHLYGWKYQRTNSSRGPMKRFPRLKKPFLAVYDPLIAAKTFLESVVDKFAGASLNRRLNNMPSPALIDAAA